MDIENLNLVIMKRHNRKIIQRSFQNSIVNTSYKFPKTHLASFAYGQLSDSISLSSRMSEEYDLRQQNVKQNQRNENQGKGQSLLAFFKCKNKHVQVSQKQADIKRNSQTSKRRFCVEKESLEKRKFLSLTPRKVAYQRKRDVHSIEKVVGINMTNRILAQKNQNNSLLSPVISQSNINPQSPTSSIFSSLRRMASKCLSFNQAKSFPLENQQQKTEAIFFNQSVNFLSVTFLNNQKSTNKHKQTQSDRLTVESTPIALGQRSSNNNGNSGSKPTKRGMSRVKMQTEICVSKFVLI